MKQGRDCALCACMLCHTIMSKHNRMRAVFDMLSLKGAKPLLQRIVCHGG